MNRSVVAFVTGVLRNASPDVTRLSPSCYAEPLEYLHHGENAGDIGKARRPRCKRSARRVREAL